MAKQPQRTLHRTMQGREIDMNQLVKQNEMVIAVGNAKVNARGDKLGPGGQIVQQKSEQLTPGNSAVPDQVNARKTTSSVTSSPAVSEEKTRRQKTASIEDEE